jgi:hypothetical protein
MQTELGFDHANLIQLRYYFLFRIHHNPFRRFWIGPRFILCSHWQFPDLSLGPTSSSPAGLMFLVLFLKRTNLGCEVLDPQNQ